ncbi:MAG TPA: hypothetical protein VD789_00685 [Thermomicrobiales bacterium]|nr:hypothetical protein [Thermomicrobiales bacterium]
MQLRAVPATGDNQPHQDTPRWRAWALGALVALICMSSFGEVVVAQIVTPEVPVPEGTPEVPVPQDPEPQVRGVTQIDSTEARLLAMRFRPIVKVRQRDAMCTGDGEPYLPVPVDLVFDNPAVKLRENTHRSDYRDPVLVTSPAISDIETADADTYLDFPGRPRNPACTYERWYRSYMTEYEPTIYARVVVADGTYVVVQYYFFYVFNDFNNNHEGDWETIQVLFEAPSAMMALHSMPEEVAYGQHAGGETAAWDSGKLEREGARPVVYVSEGSHAAHFEPGTYLGWGEKGSGFGCDDTTGPHSEVDVAVQMMPIPPVEPGEPGRWLDWRGRWGERQGWQYDGPVGPRRTKRWTDPVGWQERLRESSLAIPGTSRLGPAPTDVFCNVTTYGSIVLMRFVGAPWYFLSVFLIPLAIVGFLLYLAWSTIIAALRIYLRYLPVFAVLGLPLIPVGILASGLYELALTYSPVRYVVEVMEYTPVSYYVSAMPINGIQQLVSLGIVVPAVLEIYGAIERGERITLRRMVDGVHIHFRPMVRAGLKPLLVVVLAQLSVIGLPWAIDRAVRWGFVPHAVVLDETPPEIAPIRSMTTVRGRWWRTAATMLVLTILVAVPGPLLGIILMVTMSAAIEDINVLSSFLYAVLLPFSILGSAVLYRQRQQRVLPSAAYAFAPKDADLGTRRAT